MCVRARAFVSVCVALATAAAAVVATVMLNVLQYTQRKLIVPCCYNHVVNHGSPLSTWIYTREVSGSA